MLYVRSEQGDTNQQIEIVRQVLLDAFGSHELLARLLASPTDVFIEAGFPIQHFDRERFNKFFHDQISAEQNGSSLLGTLKGQEGSLEEVGGWLCTTCVIASWTLALGIVGVGAAGLSVLTASSAIVVAVAAFAGVAKATALLFIKGLAAAVSSGVTAVADEICRWTGAC